MIVELKDIFDLETSSVNPMHNPKNQYCLYSLPAFDDGGQPLFVRGENIGSNKFQVPNKCILFNKLNVRFRRVWKINNSIENKVCSTEFYPLLPKGNIDYNYAYYLLISDTVTNFLAGLNTNTSGSHKRIDIDTLFKIKYDISSLSEQQKIASVLSVLDKKIELNNKIIKELEAMSKELYDYWFVQFDFPNKDGKPYRSSGGAMTYNPTLKREIPLGWEVCKVSNIAKTSSGGTPTSTCNEYYNNGDIGWINSGELNDSYIVSAQKFITQKGLENSSAKIFPENTILIALYGATAGRVSLLTLSASTNQAVCAIMPNDCKYVDYIRYYIGAMYNHFVLMSTGSARDNISQDMVKDIDIIVPMNDIIMKYNMQVNRNTQKIIECLKQNQELTTLRDWLLPMLMNGQVTIQSEQSQSTKSECAVVDLTNSMEQRLELWKSTQGVAARGNIDENILKEIFDSMDDEDK